MFTRRELNITITRKEPKLPTLLKALTSRQIETALYKPTSKAAAYVAENKLSGQVLGVVTGNLRRSLLPSVKTSGATASFGTPLHYGAIWELGGPKRKKRAWLGPGTKEFVRSGEFIKLFTAALLKELRG